MLTVSPTWNRATSALGWLPSAFTASTGFGVEEQPAKTKLASNRVQAKSLLKNDFMNRRKFTRGINISV